MPKTVALAFSGGLDTSYCVLELAERGYDVVTLFVNTGGVGAEQAEGIRQRSLSLGAAEHHEIDQSQALWDRIVTPFIMGGAPYAGVYPILCADRTLIAESLATLGDAIGASALAHGCTAMGNDQVRLDLALSSVSERPVLAPIRDLQGAVALPREHEMATLRSAGFEVEADARRYSINENLLGVTMSGSEIDRFEPPDDVFARRMVAPRDAWPETPLRVRLRFDRGALVAIDGEAKPGAIMLRELNERFGAYGVGRSIYTGDTVIGLKGRILFEAPGLHALLTAHRALEEATLTSAQASFKPHAARRWTELVYAGLYHDPLRTDLESFLRSSQQRVSGEVELLSEGGSCLAVSVQSPHTLVAPGATYAQSAGWSAAQAEGFVQLFGQSTTVWHRIQGPGVDASPVGAP